MGKRNETTKSKKMLIFLTMLVAMIAMAVIAISAGKKNDSIQEKLRLGQRYLSEMNYEQAVVVYKSVIEIDPKNAEAYLGLAEAYIGQGMYKQAENCLKEGYERTNDEKIADKIEEVGKQTESIASLNETSQEDKQGSEISISQDGSENKVDDITEILTNAKQHLNNLEYDNALEEYKKVLELDPENVEAFLGIIEVLLRQGKYEDALIYAQNGYELTKDASLLEKIEMINSGRIVDNNGNILKEDQHNSDGSIKGWVRYEYDVDNKKKNITVYDADGRQIDYGEYEYDQKGNLTLAYIYNDDSFNTILYTYDELGREIKCRRLSKDGGEYIIEYLYSGNEINHYKTINTSLDKDGNIIQQFYNKSDIRAKEEHHLFHWDDKGNNIRREIYNESDMLMQVCEYEYDEKRNIIRSKFYTYDSSGNICDQIFCFFEYDKDGTLRKRQNYDGNNDMIYEIEYDKYGNQTNFTSYED